MGGFPERDWIEGTLILKIQNLLRGVSQKIEPPPSIVLLKGVFLENSPDWGNASLPSPTLNIPCPSDRPLHSPYLLSL